MTFTISNILVFGAVLSGLISFLIATVTCRPYVRYALKLPEYSIPSKKKMIGTAIAYIVITGNMFLLLLPAGMMSAPSCILLIIITASLMIFTLCRSRGFLRKHLPQANDDTLHESRTLTNSQYSLISVSLLTLLLPVIIFMGTGNLLLYVFPDITTVSATRTGYTYTTDYGWPKDEDTRMTKSYLHNLTSDTLYMVNVLYAILGENDFNDYSVSRPYPPGIFTHITRRPEYIMTEIPRIRLYTTTRTGHYRQFDSYLVHKKTLEKFKNARMNVYGLFPNHNTTLGMPTRSRVIDINDIFNYQNDVEAKLKIAGVNLHPDSPYIDHLPTFPGGRKAIKDYIANNISYPSFAEMTGSEGTVVLSFTVLADGRTADIGVVKSLDPSLDNEAIRIIREMPHWNPGILNSHPAPCRLTLPIIFSLPHKEN